jgi:hypothetical protein
MKQMKLGFFPKVPHGRLLRESFGKFVCFVRFTRKGGQWHD